MEKLTIPKVLEVEAHGLSITSSAFLLNVTAQTLHAFIKRNKIEWRGKGFNYKKGEVNPNSNFQKAKALGVCNMTIQRRMERHGISFDNAVIEDSASMQALANHVAGKIIPAVENQIGGNIYGY